MGATPIMVIVSPSLIPIVPIASLVSIGPTDAPGERDDGDGRTVGRGEKFLTPTLRIARSAIPIWPQYHVVVIIPIGVHTWSLLGQTSRRLYAATNLHPNYGERATHNDTMVTL